LIFALFDLLGMQFSPRIRDLADQRLHRVDRSVQYQHIEPLFSGMINRDLILSRWDDLLRLAASLKMGWATASLLVGKLQGFRRQNALMRYPAADEDLVHLAPTLRAHINPHGKYSFDIDTGLARTILRPLRKSTTAASA
jgi:hypothetical protein